MATVATVPLNTVTKNDLLKSLNTGCTLILRNPDKLNPRKLNTKRLLCTVVLDEEDNFWIHSVKQYNGVPSFKVQVTNCSTGDYDNINLYEREIILPGVTEVSIPVEDMQVNALKNMIGHTDSNVYHLEKTVQLINRNMTLGLYIIESTLIVAIIGVLLYLFS